MPRNVRNFWLDAEIDGRESKLSGGPARKDGGLYVYLKQRDKGEVTTAIRIECFVNGEGKLVTLVREHDGGKLLFEHVTER